MASTAIIVFLLVITICSTNAVLTGAGEVGVNYGTQGDNLPSPSDAAALLQRCGIKHVRLFEPNLPILDALRALSPGTVSVVVGVMNQDMDPIGSDPAVAQQWVAVNVAPYVAIPVRGVNVGNEVIPGPFSARVVPAIRNLRAALDAAGLQSIFVTTNVYGAAIAPGSDPPSVTTFSSESIGPLRDLVQFRNSLPPERRGPVFVHAYSFYPYVADKAHVSLDFATFQSKTPVTRDGNLTYYNMFDAIYDGVLWAFEKIGGEGIALEVGETGWPSAGDDEAATPEVARKHNKGLYDHIKSGNGTPKTGAGRGPAVAMLFALFNENLKAPGFEQNWGLFHANMTPVYATQICPAAAAPATTKILN